MICCYHDNILESSKAFDKGHFLKSEEPVNVGENKKRRLNRALQRFAAMLIEEALDLSGLPKARLAEALGITDDQVIRYTRLPGIKSSRAPQAAAVQQLENRVAKLLKRTAHTVVVQNNSKFSNSNTYFSDSVKGRPGDDLNLRQFDMGSFQLGYEGDWPTYRQLKTFRAWKTGSVDVKSLVKRHASYEEWPEMLRFYAWQWGILWERGVPWLSRENFGIDTNTKLEIFLPVMTERAKLDRRAIAVVSGFSQGRKLIDAWERALMSGISEGHVDECLVLIRTLANSIESLVETHSVAQVRQMLAVATYDPSLAFESKFFVEPGDEYFEKLDVPFN